MSGYPGGTVYFGTRSADHLGKILVAERFNLAVGISKSSPTCTLLPLCSVGELTVNLHLHSVPGEIVYGKKNGCVARSPTMRYHTVCVGMAYEVTDTPIGVRVAVRADVVMAPVVECPPGVVASLPGHRGALALAMLCLIVQHLAPIVFIGVDGSDEGGTLGLYQPPSEELVVEPAPAMGVRLDVVSERSTTEASASTGSASTQTSATWLFTNTTRHCVMRRSTSERHFFAVKEDAPPAPSPWRN